MTRIMFVCLGNICRSPMAEFLMKNLLSQKGLAADFHVSSSGTSGWHNGEDMHCGTSEVLDGLKINSQGFVSSQVQASDFEHYNYIIAMDQDNLTALERLFGQASKRVFVITDLIPNLGYQGVPDPWHTGDFDETRDLLTQACESLLHHIQQNQGH